MTVRPVEPATVVVVGLGPGAPGDLTAAAAEAIASVPVRFVRTWRHPSASVVAPATSFDDVYEASARLPEVYEEIVERLVRAATREGRVLYAVPGSPLVAERTVELLRGDPRVDVEVLPALSFLDLAWARLGVDPVAAGVRIVDGHRFAEEAAGERGPLLVAQTDTAAVLSEIKLAVDDGPQVVVLQRLGTDREALTSVAWADLDRGVDADHLTCVWIPALAAPVAGELVALDELVRTLRQRCPWDRVQTHRSLTRHLLEETYEVLEAVDALPADPDPLAGDYDDLEEELGDLMFQVFLHAALASEAGGFTVADVARGIHDKLVGRHPHVFAGADPDEAIAGWEQRKLVEKGRTSVMEGIPGHLPSLLHASKVQSKAASAGYEERAGEGTVGERVRHVWSALDGAAARAAGPPPPGGEPAVIDDLGDVLFSVVELARHAAVDPEAALRRATGKFRDRFVTWEGRPGGGADGTRRILSSGP